MNLRTGIKRIFYPAVAKVAKFLYRDKIEGKVLRGSTRKLFYEKSQHLGFLFQKTINYESAFRDIILKSVNPCDLVIEAGSNIGQYSLLISEKIGGSGKLVCLEPDSNNFAYLSFNVLQNQCDNVILIKGAISDKPGKSIFFRDTITGGRMGSLIKKYTGENFEGKSEEVVLWTMKQLIDQFGVPAFVKIDVEGAEDLIFQDHTTIHPNTTYLVEVRNETKKSIFEIFNSLGFYIYILELGCKKATSLSDIPAFANLLIKKGEM